MREALPLHLQVLVHLREEVTVRKQQLEERCGTGLSDQDYQRHVGRIKECAVTLEGIQTLMKGGLEQIEDQEDSRNDRRTPKRSARTTQ